MDKIKSERVKEVVGGLSALVNSFSSYEKEFAQAVLNEHRTLQQSIFRLFYACMKKWSESYEANNYDLRNEDTCRISHEIVKFLKSKDDDYIRFI